MATHSSIPAWKIPWTEEGYSPWGHKKSDTTERLHTHACNKTLYCYTTNLNIFDNYFNVIVFLCHPLYVFY